MKVPCKIPDTAFGYINRESMKEMRGNYFALPALFRPQLAIFCICYSTEIESYINLNEFRREQQK